MSLTYFHQPFEESWTQTDRGIDEDRYHPSFLWHFVPTFLMVFGTEFEEAFLIRTSAIWAAHWPEDVTFGEKPLHQRTSLMKRVVYPPGYSGSELDIEDLELCYGVPRYEAQTMIRDKITQATLYSFFNDNNQTYQRILHTYANDEARKMWHGMMNSIRNFLVQAVNNFHPYIQSYGLPPSAWETSLNQAVLLWDVHNHLPVSFHKEYPSWPRYHYLMKEPENRDHRTLIWEYPSALSAVEAALPPPWLPW
ncbi:hypothetical protein C8R41DRAFT_863113 [Lentinula lateritia]|uniref:Uncharacterized protein n=1 Tax=Lentinula lateritia TaxID=40482 RepID=A0ABQ8VVW6_9AGAR|nr:hypothetical protein C8R41DRAFT_863113 [Lentinula lateritia]